MGNMNTLLILGRGDPKPGADMMGVEGGEYPPPGVEYFEYFVDDFGYF